jgi:hemolysin activation/secretion protein
MAGVGLLLTQTCLVQAQNDAGSILRDIERSTGQQRPAAAPLAPESIAPPAEAPLPSKPGEAVFVRGYRVTGSRFTVEELQSVLAPYIGRRATLSEIQEAARRIGDFYRQRDILAHAFVPAQTIREGIVEITVVEGKLGTIKVDPATPTRLDHDLATGIVGYRLPRGESVQPSVLDEAVAVLNETPGVRAKSVLAAGESAGETDVILVIDDKPLVSGSLILANAGSTGTGTRQVIGSASLDNALGHGDRLAATVLRTAGSQYGKLAAQAPVGHSGLTVGISGAALKYEVGGKVKDLRLNGTSRTVGTNVLFPVRRGSDFSLTASGGFDVKRLVDKTDRTTTSNKAIKVVNSGLSSTLKDDWMGGGTNSLGTTLHFGHLSLAGNGDNRATDHTTARSEGFYHKLVFDASREQAIIDNVTLVPSVAAQWTPHNLDSSEKFSLGGSDGVRGYPTGEGSGDLGARISMELRWKALETLQLATFYDYGKIRQHNRTWTNWEPRTGARNFYDLHGVGVSGLWTMTDWLSVRGTVAAALGPNDGRDNAGYDSDGRNRDARAWLQVIGSF